MTIDTLLFDTLGPLVANAAYPDEAPESAPLPRIVHQQIGGDGLAYQEGTLPTTEGCRVQVAVWTASRLTATALAKQAEEAILAQPGWQAEPVGGRTSLKEPGELLYGSRQDFYIRAPR
jgi:hypothetical protein